MVQFARTFDLTSADALQRLAEFTQELMTNVGAADLLRRVDTLTRGAERKQPNEVELAALIFQSERTFDKALDLVTEINKQGGVRVFRPAVLYAFNRALQMCRNNSDITLYDAVVQMREQNRLLGRPLPKRAVGSTLLLKGLEAEVAVLLTADQLNAKNLYVAMTRASKKLLICSKSPVLPLV